jgi:stringent starvation protein B
MAESSTKPYMIRALHEWCTDNGYTPHLTVKVDSNTMVPRGYIKDGQITLNIDSLATNRLVIGNEAIEFQARFNGVTEDLYVPVAAVAAIYARETGAGMAFEATDSAAPAAASHVSVQADKGSKSEDDPKDPPPARPKLSIVK